MEQPLPALRLRAGRVGWSRAAAMAGSLADERYVNLATFRRSGKEVRTPVWIAGEGDRLYVYTNRKSGKVKRIRANGRARLAPCDVRGRLRGDWVEAKAHLVEEPGDVERGFVAILRKYGWQMRMALWASRLSGRYEDRAIVELRLSE